MYDETTVQGVVNRLYYQSEKFCAGELETLDKPVRFRGPVYVCASEFVQLVGNWVRDPKYGWQFHTAERVYHLRIDKNGLAAWLKGHAKAKGIGPVRALAIAEELGEDFGEVLKSNPERIARMAQVPLEAIRQLAQDWSRNENLNLLGTHFSAYGISPKQIEAIYQHFGANAYVLLADDPYAMTQIKGIGFKTADAIAQKYGMQATDPRRIDAALHYVLQDRERQGDTCLEFRSYVAAAGELLGVGQELVARRIPELLQQGTLVAREADQLRYLTSRRNDQTEWALYQFLQSCREPNPFVPDEGLDDLVREHCGWLDDSQQQAVLSCLRQRGTLITGGAGVGKTTILNALFKMYNVLLPRLRCPAGPSFTYTRLARRVVYLFKSRLTGLYKIGVSQSVITRMRDLEVKPGEIELLLVIPADDPFVLEKQLHEQFAPKRERSAFHETNEWFRLDDDDLQSIRDTVANTVLAADFSDCLTRLQEIRQEIQQLDSQKGEHFLNQKVIRRQQQLLAEAEHVQEELAHRQHELSEGLHEDVNDQGPFVVLPCAPTGKASRRLTEMFHGLLGSRTIHRTLGCFVDRDRQGRSFLRFEYNKDHPLPAQVIVVDEFSMVDVHLAKLLFDAIRPTTALVLVGDHNQLPPVGAGAILRDAIHNQLLPVNVLTHCHRQAGTLSKNCEALLEGTVPANVRGNGPIPSPWYVADNLENPEQILAMLRKIFTHHLPAWNKGIHQVQVMTPIHAGELGTRAINLLLQEIYQASLGTRVEPTPADRRPTFYVGDRVIHTKNNYPLGVMNGSIGVVRQLAPLLVDIEGRLVDYSPPRQKKDTVQGDDGRSKVIIGSDGEQDEEDTCLEKSEFSSFDREDFLANPKRHPKLQLELGYCLTPHKFQGSEVDVAVVICSKKHSFMLHRNWLYTACTRARQTCILLGDRWALRKAAESTQANNRQTLLPLFHHLHQSYPE